MLKEILAISGKPGLYKLISYGKNQLVVEGLKDKKRVPAYTRDRVISLGDIAMYTTGEDVPLAKVFESIYAKYEGKTVCVKDYETGAQLCEFMLGVLPDFDQERVYNSDIKKLISWYNTLVEAGFTTFVKEESEEQPAEESAE